jgi:hypothetical protein
VGGRPRQRQAAARCRPRSRAGSHGWATSLMEEAASATDLRDGQACVGGRPPRQAGGAARSGLRRRVSSHGWVTSSTRRWPWRRACSRRWVTPSGEGSGSLRDRPVWAAAARRRPRRRASSRWWAILYQRRASSYGWVMMKKCNGGERVFNFSSPLPCIANMQRHLH